MRIYPRTTGSRRWWNGSSRRRRISLQFVKYQPPVPALDFSDLRRAKEIIGDQGITAPWVSGVFNTLADIGSLTIC